MVVSRCRPLPKKKGSGGMSIPNPFCWNADMSLHAQKLVKTIAMCGQLQCVVNIHAICVLLVGLSAGSNGPLEPRGVITQTMECSVG